MLRDILRLGDLRILFYKDNRVKIFLFACLFCLLLLAEILFENSQEIKINEALINITKGELIVAASASDIQLLSLNSASAADIGLQSDFTSQGIKILAEMRNSFHSPQKIDSLITYINTNNRLPQPVEEIRDQLFRDRKKLLLLKIKEIL